MSSWQGVSQTGSYRWWRDNYKTDKDYQNILSALSTFGWDISATEIDHFPPASTYEASGFYKPVAYDDMPAFPLIYPLHQPSRGHSYSGGYATSSKSSNLAKDYREILSDDMSVDTGTFASSADFFKGEKSGYFKAMLFDLTDKQNLALYATATSGSAQRSLFNPVLRPAVFQAYHLGLISQTEADFLLSKLYD